MPAKLIRGPDAPPPRFVARPGEWREAPTERQVQVYAWIYDYTRTHGFQPSLREVAAQFRYKSQNSIIGHLSLLQQRGYVSFGAAAPASGASRLARRIRFLKRPDGRPFTGFADVP